MNLEQYAYQDDDRWYVNPQVSLGEQNAFIDNLRNLQAQDNADIQQQTYALGTRVPSNLGGLSGAGSYFKSRYQTPQTNSMVADLKAAAQAQALTTLLQNEINKAKKKYSDAYSKTNGGGGTGGDNTNLSGLKTVTDDDESGEKQKIVYSPEKSSEAETPGFDWFGAALLGGTGLAAGSMIPFPGLGILSGLGLGYLGGQRAEKSKKLNVENNGD